MGILAKCEQVERLTTALEGELSSVALELEQGRAATPDLRCSLESKLEELRGAHAELLEEARRIGFSDFPFRDSRLIASKDDIERALKERRQVAIDTLETFMDLTSTNETFQASLESVQAAVERKLKAVEEAKLDAELPSVDAERAFMCVLAMDDAEEIACDPQTDRVFEYFDKNAYRGLIMGAYTLPDEEDVEEEEEDNPIAVADLEGVVGFAERCPLDLIADDLLLDPMPPVQNVRRKASVALVKKSELLWQKSVLYILALMSRIGAITVRHLGRMLLKLGILDMKRPNHAEELCYQMADEGIIYRYRLPNGDIACCLSEYGGSLAARPFLFEMAKPKARGIFAIEPIQPWMMAKGAMRTRELALPLARAEQLTIVIEMSGRKLVVNDTWLYDNVYLKNLYEKDGRLHTCLSVDGSNVPVVFVFDAKDVPDDDSALLVPTQCLTRDVAERLRGHVASVSGHEIEDLDKWLDRHRSA